MIRPRLIDRTVLVDLLHPQRGVVVLEVGDELPEWAVGLVGDHLLDRPAGSDGDEPEGPPPPMHGVGSGTGEWLAYGRSRGLTFEDDTRKGDIVEALKVAGKIPSDY